MAEAARPLPDISQIELIMAEIFQHLNTQDLESCRQALGYWERYIANERRKRREVFPFFWTCNVHGEMHDCHHEHENPRSIHDDIRVKVGKYASRRCVPLLFCTHHVVYDADTLFPGIQPTVLTDEYRRMIESENADDWLSDEAEMVRSELRQLVIKALRRNFPCSPQIILSTNCNFMGCGEDLELRHLRDRHAFVGFIIPQYPGFEIHNFEIPNNKNFSLIPVHASRNIKGLLVFSDESDTFNRVVRLVQRRRIYKVAIGAYESIQSSIARNGSIIAFCGENVETASLVVSPLDKEAAERKLKLFKYTTLLKNKCFAFVFNCDAFESNLNKELAKTFTQLYPTTPLVGLTTRITCGVDYLPGVPQIIKTLYLHHLLKKDRVAYAYEDQSVFLLVSINP